MDIQDIRNKVNVIKAELSVLQRQKENVVQSIKRAKKVAIKQENALVFVREVGLQTQEQLQYHISDLTSMALDAVFGDEAYEMKVTFITRRGKVECDLSFVRNGHEIDPLESSGCGAVDIAAFSLRVASWALSNPQPKPVIILDEPFRYVSKRYRPLASQMIQQVSRRLGIQFIIVTHDEVLAQYADKIFEVSIHNDISKINEIALNETS